jgi:hypothetical protein
MTPQQQAAGDAMASWLNNWLIEAPNEANAEELITSWEQAKEEA